MERDFGGPPGTPPMFTPFRLRGLTLRNRVVVSPMDMYSAADGVPGDFHLVHLGARAMGGAGLVMTEMVCVSEEGRITPGCAGLYTGRQAEAWKRITNFVHDRAPGTAIGVQLGHSGRKGSTKLMWEGMDEPLPEGNWPLVAASALPYKPFSQTPRELSRAQLTDIREQFAAAACRAARAGFDLLELHCAHGYLLSGFLSPLTNRRTDAYGGSLEKRLRFPLEVFDAVRNVWPGERPMTVRISATDWAEGGTTAEDAVEIARAFAAHGADAIDVSTGQVVADERPEFGRSYQTPFADRIRNATGIPVIAVGAISSWDDVNSLILGGRTDLCALARPHLYDPHWTLHAAAEQGYTGPGAVWPAPYRAGSPPPADGQYRTRPSRALDSGELERPTNSAPASRSRSCQSLEHRRRAGARPVFREEFGRQAGVGVGEVAPGVQGEEVVAVGLLRRGVLAFLPGVQHARVAVEERLVLLGDGGQVPPAGDGLRGRGEAEVVTAEEVDVRVEPQPLEGVAGSPRTAARARSTRRVRPCRNRDRPAGSAARAASAGVRLSALARSSTARMSHSACRTRAISHIVLSSCGRCWASTVTATAPAFSTASQQAASHGVVGPRSSTRLPGTTPSSPVSRCAMRSTRARRSAYVHGSPAGVRNAGRSPGGPWSSSAAQLSRSG
ncbi:NADPH dehydrogenase [Streptomyces violarus]